MARTLQHEIGKKKPFDLPEEEAYLNLLRTVGVLSADFGSMFREHGLSEATYNVLRILRGHGPEGCSCGVIGDEMVTQVPDVTRLVDRLESMGLAERRRIAGDRRVVIVAISTKGLDLLDRLDKPARDIHRAQLGHMTKAELVELSRLLVRARSGAESKNEK